MLSTLIAPDIVEYLDTGKVGARTVAGDPIMFGRLGPERSRSLRIPDDYVDSVPFARSLSFRECAPTPGGPAEGHRDDRAGNHDDQGEVDERAPRRYRDVVA
jgi:hypothetical protein